MSSPNRESKEKTPVFPVGPAASRELRRALRSTDPVGAIQAFQQSHSLHSMMSRAFGTTPRYEAENDNDDRDVESLDTDSVMQFLSHLGVNQYDAHSRISKTLLKELEDEIGKTQSQEPLLELLKSSWFHATTLRELRPIIWALLKQLGENTPLAVLTALAERDNEGGMKHAEIFKQLTPLLQRLVWEADWEQRIPLEPDTEPKKYLEQVKSTLLFETIEPLMEQYYTSKHLVDSANQPFVATNRERRMLTKQRRALTSTSATSSSSAAPGGGVGRVLRGSQKQAMTATESLSSSEAVSQLHVLLCDSGGSSSSYRSKLLYPVLSVLIAQHGADEKVFLGGADHLHCTLVADILLSTGGPLPKAYTYVFRLARILDDCVQEGQITDENIAKLQGELRQIFQPDQGDKSESSQKKPASMKEDTASGSIKRQLNRLITAGLTAMKEADPQNLFLNPVTDEIAPGYSRIISKPMCIVKMETKVTNGKYNSIGDWDVDVRLMFKNCIDYNQGEGGRWFRGEALRQKKVFEDEIFPQARRMYKNEVAKRSVNEESSGRKRKAGEDRPEITPLSATTKKRKKEKEEYVPSMPALAAMLMADPFIVRIIIARTLRELQNSVIGGNSLPAAHSVVPSLLQFLHMARWSTQICAIRGKKYFVPDVGLELSAETEDPTAIVPYESLRRYLPLLLRLFLEAELDRRVIFGGDLHDAAQSSSSLQPAPLGKDEWRGDNQLEVVVSLVEGALVYVCQPGNADETSLSVTFPKFALALQNLSASLWDDRAFFLCLIKALLRHKAKLSKAARDSILDSWLKWLHRRGDKTNGSMTCAAHECLVLLLNEWSALGNQVLPRDSLLKFAANVVRAADESETSENRKFVHSWKSEAPDFAAVRKQYERMLRHLPSVHAKQWREQVGIEKESETKGPTEPKEADDKEAVPMEE